ncbi:iron-sulfur cluster assembly scaffold protein [Falsirhodobacter deserti]|uniref:iron-sulfur cluster assembly scaffold protein n=1 Tax=Falsirhodobacter deserti TaxID=1365611 RepID=UPI000FE4109A|nr:iron-sulfur cluster assembly scaffold protein [Falsirhodobacter deserti]
MSALYSTELLALAADIPHTGRLADATGSATCRSPVCGSTVTVDVAVGDGLVSRFAQEVRTCLLGQASASLMGAAIMGTDANALTTALKDVEAMLTGGPAPQPPFDSYRMLQAAREHAARHAAILLPLRAAVEAMEKSRQR